MYRITVKTNGIEYLLHDPRDEEMQLISPELTEEVGKNGLFTFEISPLHPNKDKIIPMASEIIIYQDDKKIFACRLLDSEKDFYKSGRGTCEGELAYLLDSIQRPYEYTGNIRGLLNKLLANHNGQVEKRKQFLLGDVTVVEASIVRNNEEYSNTMNEMLSKLVEPNGGYLHVRYVGEEKYLDYVNDYGGINQQPVRFGENLIDLSERIDPSELITALIPIGATIQSENSDEEDTEVTITSVNNGKDYIYNQAAVEKYGKIWGVRKFEDVTDPGVLLAKARAYLEESSAIPVTIELKAVDLSLINIDVESMKIGCWTDIISEPHELKKRLLLSKKTVNLEDPARNEIILGQVTKTFTGDSAKQEMALNDRINSVASNASKEINKKVENATQLITGGKGGYVVLDVDDPDSGKRTLPWRILVMDAPDKNVAKSVIQINKNGIGFSTTGIKGPYRNAWTIDGNLIADFITAGTMLADRVRGGTLELGGSGLGKDGKIIVRDANNKEIGYWDKSGLHIALGVIEGSRIEGNAIKGGSITGSKIEGGTLELGGSGLGKDGKIIVRDANNKEIGYWDKSGLHIALGVIEGSRIEGNAIKGGSITGSKIEGGTLELGGSGLGKDGKIIVRDANNKEIGYWDKSGLHIALGVIEGSRIEGNAIKGGSITGSKIEGGTLELGGSGLGKDGKIIVRDANNKEIGYWDKSGLHIALGVIEGSRIEGNAIKGGTITGSYITGSTIEAGDGLFYADEDSVCIASFYTYKTRYGEYLATSNSDAGMGDNNFYNFWTGWDGTWRIEDGNPETVLRHYGCVLTPRDAYAQELYLNGSIFEGKSHYWGVGECIEDLYGRIYALESSVESAKSE